VLGSAAAWLGVNWLRASALAASVAVAGAAGVWATLPVTSTGVLVDAAGRPVAGAAVSAATTLLSPAAEAVTDAQGRYRLDGHRWPAGPAELAVQAAGFLPARTAGGRLVLHRWPRLSGQAVDDVGAPVAGAVVTVARAGAVLAAVMANLDGRFALVLPAAGGTFAATGVSDEHDAGTSELPLGIDQTATVQLTLARQFGVLHIESDPAGQAPQVDGAAPTDCPATPCDAKVPVGAHRVAFGGDLFVPWQADVLVDRGATAAVSAPLVRKTGTLTVVAPPGGELTVDGQAVSGNTWSGQVPTGRHAAGFRSAATWPVSQPFDVTWNRVTQATLAPAGVSGAGDAAGFAAGLRAYLAAQGGGSYGVYLEELGSGAAIGVGDTTGLEAASVIKVPEAIYLLRQVDAGQVKLDDQVKLEAGDFMGGTGSLYGTAHPGDQYTYRELLSLLIQQSDNTAWLALRRTLGDGSIDAYAASIGAGDCDQSTDWCSARSAGHMLAQLARGRLLGAASTRMLLGLLESTIFNDRINWYLQGMTIAHKVGMDGTVRNDCGVVFMTGDPFAICVFATVGDVDQGTQVIRDIARAAAWHYSH
jgi:Beta-lactamase enzyme family/Carboxypeptidase regulatory-like domain/PEGA domain